MRKVATIKKKKGGKRGTILLVLHNTLDNFGWISSDNCVWWNISCDDGAGADSGTNANLDTRKDGNVSSNPAILFNDNWLAKLGTFGSIASSCVEWMSSRIDVDIRSDQSSGFDGDSTCIDNCAAKVDKNTRTKLIL